MIVNPNRLSRLEQDCRVVFFDAQNYGIFNYFTALCSVIAFSFLF